ncbi:molybdate ABC transporter permease subunit [Phycisphaera mikurensis]|uniref:Putative molybdenum ABC transporter permease protein n=1 Tax=Phycisphaera mikurensis (strain NBRC 102666 / KCTC 22515 / FYK2301M01) TaxID=1142394 RepID=I0IFN5_PHYMF|nr:ABC transporter permease subunit [Phycisphaera mikurensis]MBB6440537.1 molybdate transport system permease protein [Phycisphaera mikurensis]BAM04073.1 putative molybdenum ABC transporter permease protein [Phycisphaera mikurensis NBRC 102666]
MLLPSLRLSLEVALLATLLAAALAVPLAWAARAGRRRRRATRIVEAAVLLPLVLPPTVVGYAGVRILGRDGPAGWLGVPLVFTLPAAVLAAALVALPLVYLPTRAAFDALEPDLLDAGRQLGAGRYALLRHVAFPLARAGLAAGLVLGFARALGEFGATVMVFGWQPGRTTLPIAIYAAFERGDLRAAAAPAACLALLALGAVLLERALRRR